MSESFGAAWAAAWNAHDVDAVVAWYAADGMHRMASGNTYRGADELRAMVTRSVGAYPDLSFTVRDAFVGVDGRHFTIEYTMRGTQESAIGDRPGTGRTIEIDGVLVGTTDDAGHVTTCVDYLDHLAIRRQLGLADDLTQRGSVGSVMFPGRVMPLGSVIPLGNVIEGIVICDTTHWAYALTQVALALMYCLPAFTVTASAPAMLSTSLRSS